MPLPTATLQLPGARPSHQKSTSFDQIRANKLNSMKTSIPTSRNGSGELVADTSRAERQLSSKASISSISSIPALTGSNRDNVATQRKSFLPQRSSSVRVKREVSEKVQGQNEGSRLQQPGSVQQRLSQQDLASASRRQSLLVQPQDYRASLSGKDVPPGSPTDRNSTTPASPLKKQVFDSKSTAPSSPLKSQMLPPPRPMRSVSLRQPPTPKIVPSGDSKGHVRHRSQVLGAAASQALKQTDGSSSLPKVKPPRPQFSTYQQHFSPKKEPKPPTSTTVSSRSSESDAGSIPASRPDVAALQTEYLQLYLLHSSSSQRNAEWRTNSEKELRKKYDSVAGLYRVLLAEERDAQHLLNVRALHHWSANTQKNHSCSDFAAQIQTLSRVIQEVMDLSEPHGGRYTKAVRIFEDWLERAVQIRDKRRRSETAPLDTLDEEPDFIDPLDRAWKGEINALNAKVELCLRELQNLDIAPLDELGNPDAALLRIANGHKDLLISMMEELKAMRTIESEIVGLERSWTARTTDRLRAVDESDMRGPRVGAWKRA
ncbi:hypothetical protein VTN77DRAFT_4122 [Rasamsonia byssochlamydoides]|uniref:uncharacterized protein n=1 Tax=Rasamsonia byssochlamydoides TaxID=89139 RepID=UPI00374374A2